MIRNFKAVRSYKIIFLTLVALLAFTVLINCGGGGGSGVSTGVFIDSPVHGLGYETQTQRGVTDSEGRFAYKSGESVTFHIGNVILGQALGKEIITPFDLVPEALDETHPTLTNILIFLQSLDTDCNLENGIQISEAAQAEIGVRQIVFDVTVDDFIQSIQGLFDALNDLNVFTDCIPRLLRSPEEAQEHFRQVLNNSDFDGDGYTPIQGDCDDFNAAINSEAPETCGDSIDQDCNGDDLECTTTTTTTLPPTTTTTAATTTTTTAAPTTTTTAAPTTTTTAPPTTTTTAPPTTTTTSSTTTTTLSGNTMIITRRTGIKALSSVQL